MKKLLSTTIAVGIMATMGVSPVFADIAATTLPTGWTTDGLSDISVNGADMKVQVNAGAGGVSTINWNTYNVGKDASVNYEFTAHNQTSLNRVTGTDVSQIYGSIKSTGCQGCGFDGTGKIILLNPNGVVFGDGANVNVNSFTVSTLDGTYNNNQLKLTNSGKSPYGIIVRNGAEIYGDKGVTFASDNVAVYNGSKISTSVNNNVGDAAFGKIKIVTADGVTFDYYNNGAVSAVSGEVLSGDKMLIAVQGQLNSGNIDIRNFSTNANSQINLKNAALKATKAVNGNDGNIWLTAANKVVIDNSKLATVNAPNAADADGGNIRILTGNKISIKASNLDAVGNVDLTANGTHAVIDSSIVNAKNVILNAGDTASIQNGSEVNALDKITLTAANISQVNASKLNATNEINLISAKDVWVENANLNAGKITMTATTGEVTGSADLNNKKTFITAGKNIDINLKNVAERQNGLVANAKENMTITTPGTLSVSSLIAGGNMTLKANEIISGYGKTTEQLKTPGDSTDRAYIQVGGYFDSTPGFEVTESAVKTDDGLYNTRHHIQYGADGSEKILLVNNRPADGTEPTPPVQPVKFTVNSQEAQKLNKIPAKPDSYSYVANISDTRTTFVDVFAAASQIEIVDDEEE